MVTEIEKVFVPLLLAIELVNLNSPYFLGFFIVNRGVLTILLMRSLH